MDERLISDLALARNPARSNVSARFVSTDAQSATSGDVACGAVLSPLPLNYGVIYADPPWQFATYSYKGKGRSAEAHYDCMGLDEIKAIPIADWAASDCALFLWTTDPLLPRTLEVIAAWGFAYKTVAFTWVKTTKDGAGFPMRLLDESQSRAVSIRDTRTPRAHFSIGAATDPCSPRSALAKA